LKLKILESAKQDLSEGFGFYESQKRGLGSYFLESLFSDIESLRLFAGVHGVHFGRYHRLLSKRFPFAVYYRMEDNEVSVYAVLDCRRDPAWARKRLQ
jgi:hypothetical protein